MLTEKGSKLTKLEEIRTERDRLFFLYDNVLTNIDRCNEQIHAAVTQQVTKENAAILFIYMYELLDLSLSLIHSQINIFAQEKEVLEQLSDLDPLVYNGLSEAIDVLIRTKQVGLQTRKQPKAYYEQLWQRTWS